MADTVPIHCAKCGAYICNIAHVPGKQKLGCKECGLKTIVVISENGHINTKQEGDCFISTIICNKLKKDDNCVELNTLRQYRDNYIKNLDGGENLLSEYKAISKELAPKLEKITNNEYFQSIYNKHIIKILSNIDSSKYEIALENYKLMLKLLDK